jgi:hypothetical protein
MHQDSFFSNANIGTGAVDVGLPDGFAGRLSFFRNIGANRLDSVRIKTFTLVKKNPAVHAAAGLVIKAWR